MLYPKLREAALVQSQSSGFASSHGRSGDITSRFLVPDLPSTATEGDLLEYFGALGEVEEVSVKELSNGRCTGSIKFTNPTMELRNAMLKKRHQILGCSVSVQTWKMQKLARPSAVASQGAPDVYKGAPDAWWMKGGGYPYGGKDFWGPSWGPMGKGPPMHPYGGKGDDWAWMAPCKGYKGYGKGPAGGFWDGYAGKGCWGATGSAPGKDDDKDITARYLLPELPESISEEAIENYFSAFGELEEVTVKTIESSGKVTGSVKFASPTLKLRDQMLKDKHEIDGEPIIVQTWKMQKMAKPGWKERKDEENARRAAVKGFKGWGKGYMPY